MALVAIAIGNSELTRELVCEVLDSISELSQEVPYKAASTVTFTDVPTQAEILAQVNG